MLVTNQPSDYMGCVTHCQLGDLVSRFSPMGMIALAIWLILFGVLGLVSTEIPRWIVPLTAIITGLIIGFGYFRSRP